MAAGVRANEETQALPAERARRRRIIKATQIILGLFLVVVVARGLWASTLESDAHQPAVPQQIGGFALQQAMVGQEALEAMKQLHGKGVGVIDGWVGHYQGGATVWVGSTENESQAVQLNEAMTSRIQAGNAMFKDLQKLQVGGTTVYTVVGQGQRHYYYQARDRVIWIAAPTGAEARFLQAAMQAIH